MFLSCCSPRSSNVRSILPAASSCTRDDTHTPPGCARPSRRAAMLTPSPKMSPSSTTNVALMDADAPLDAVLRNRRRVALGRLRLHFAGAAQRIDGAAEFDQQTVAGGL